MLNANFPMILMFLQDRYIIRILSIFNIYNVLSDKESIWADLFRRAVAFDYLRKFIFVNSEIISKIVKWYKTFRLSSLYLRKSALPKIAEHCPYNLFHIFSFWSKNGPNLIFSLYTIHIFAEDNHIISCNTFAHSPGS